jgi:molecular chaperone DnaK
LAGSAGPRMRQSVGLETKGGRFTILIKRGSALPAMCSEIFTPGDAGQTSIQIKVFRGRHKTVTRNRGLGVFEVSGIPPGPAGQPQIEITFAIDPADNLTVSARDLGTGAAMPVRRL